MRINRDEVADWLLPAMSPHRDQMALATLREAPEPHNGAIGLTAEPPDPACVEGHRQLVIVYCVDGRGL